MKRFGDDADNHHEEAGRDCQAYDLSSYRLPSHFSNPQVAHRLKAESEKDRGEWREVVHQHEDLKDHARGADEQANHQEAHAAIKDHSARHDKRRQKSYAGEKQDDDNWLEPEEV
jgi:hypothetical protein